MATPNLLELSRRERETLEACLVEFDESWQEDALAHWVANKLPPPENPLRPLALAEMVKIDLDRQWQRGRQLTLGSYLERFPELGTPDTVSADLILAEYEARRESGAPADLSQFARRFPRQAAELADLIQNAGPGQSVPPLSFEQPPAAERDTSRAGPSTETLPQEQEPAKGLPETFGRYRILNKLGQGGMGAVYLAHDPQLDRQVALKVPSFSATERREVVERFLREARAMATIRHPNLCPVYDVGEIDGIHYMTMAYIEGHLLSETIRPDNPVPERQCATVVHTLALALQEAHGRGIIHRDLKPTNIFIDERGEPVIMDFGLARRTELRDAALTQSGALLGTPAYMSPEQARGQIQAVGRRADIYSLGVILYELLTGQRPFRGELVEVLAQILSDDPEPPSTHRPGLDTRLESICLKAMAKRPEDRYETMTELAAALGEYLQTAKESPLASRPAASVRPSAPARRGSPDPAETRDRPVSAASGKPPVPDAARSGDRPQQETPGEETYGLSEAVAGLSGLLPDAEFSSVGAVDRSEDRPQPKPVPRRRVLRPIWIATGFAAAAVLLGVILYVATNHGHVKIELSDPAAQVEVKLDGDDIDITGPDHRLRVRAGEHDLLVTGENFETVTRSFTVKRGSEELLRISLLPKAAIYTVEIEPADARLTVSGEEAMVVGEGTARAVTVTNPDGHRKILLLAKLRGYQDEEREFQPLPGESRVVQFHLQPLPGPSTMAGPSAPAPAPSREKPNAKPQLERPASIKPESAVYHVEMQPAEAMLFVAGPGAAVSGAGATRKVTVANPDGKTTLVLVATASGYQGERREFQPVPNEVRDLTLRLQRLPETPKLTPPSPKTLAGRSEKPPVGVPQPKAPPDKPEPSSPAGPAGPLATVTNSIGMKLVLVPAGEFLMGSKVLDGDAEDEELPRHRVRITKAFYLGSCEVTLGQFRQFVEDAGYTEGADQWREQFRDKDKSDDLPVAYVNWQNASEFCKWLSAKEGKTYRLPTEAEWEYASRAGTQTRFSFGDEEGQLGQYAWYSDNSGSAAHPVGQKKPNAWGLYDMHGNVYEWCHDWYDGDYYDQFKSEVAVDPAGPDLATYRVLRGGSWCTYGRVCRSANRDWYVPGIRDDGIGFRVALGR